MTAPATDKLPRETILALVAMSAAIFLVANDFTALSVAIPDIQNDYSTTLNRTQWVINGYTVVFGVLIVTGGRIADLLGRRKIFLIGAAIFGAFSLMAALSPGIWTLIGARALMGIGAAMMWPAILGMTYAILPDSKAGLAGGLIIGVAGLGNAAGPLVGGLLTDTLGWRWVFVVNIPVALLAIWITARNVPESTGTVINPRIDYRGIATLSAGVILILAALDQGTNTSFTEPLILFMFAIGFVLLGLFARFQSQSGDWALVPKAVTQNRQFMIACIILLPTSAVFFGVIVFLPQFFENSLKYSALDAGAALLPMMLSFAGTSFVAGNLFNRLGAKVSVTGGSLALTLGMFLLSFLDDDTSYTSLIPGMIVVGIGVGLFYSSITTAGITVLDPDLASLGGGIMYMVQIAGGSVGLGLNTAIVLAASDMADGIATAFLVDSVLAGIGLVIAVLFLGTKSERHHHIHLPHRHRAHAP